MGIDSSQLTIAVIRALLVTVVLYFFGRYINANPPKMNFIRRIWYKETASRQLLIKYYWVVGLGVFLINILILYLMWLFS